MPAISLPEETQVPYAAPAQTPAARWQLAGLALCTLLPALGSSIANVALPTLTQAFGAPFQSVQWVVIAYLLGTTALVVSAGRLGDIIGRRRLLLAGTLLFTVASLLCGAAPTLGLLIAARAVNGLAAAIMMALSLALAGETGSKARIGVTMGLMGTMSAIGTALGPSLGGVLIAACGWRAIFLCNVPLGAAAYLLARHYLPADRLASAPERATFDWAGTAALAVTLGAYALGMTLGRGRFGPVNLALAVAAISGAVAFVRIQSNSAAPLVQLSMFRDRWLSASLATSALVATVLMTTLVVGPFYLARALALDPAAIGAVLSTGPVVVALSGFPAGRLVDRFGPQRSVVAGLAAITVGSLALSVLPASLGIRGYVSPLIVVTAGYALFQTGNNAAVMANVLPGQRGVLSGLLNLSRNLGLVTGASVMGALFAAATGTSDIMAARADAVAHGLRATFAAATILSVGAIVVTMVAPGRPGKTEGA